MRESNHPFKDLEMEGFRAAISNLEQRESADLGAVG